MVYAPLDSDTVQHGTSVKTLVSEHCAIDRSTWRASIECFLCFVLNFPAIFRLVVICRFSDFGRCLAMITLLTFSVVVFLSRVSRLSHNRLFLDFILFFTFLVPFKPFLVFF